ncbi:MAG: hypothetical protein QS748_12885 [Candidatus Endonucleobacter bathymodioli]|uniref:Uncharacterized protein n=1 Tax=Candidatus Endonucleibacter bathymodioli TaxID=539814 RepID=A0AA90SYS7_9GAMM|nr:hypothetical protein [Candidatus Endonucleobacter bathymodioli]
MSIVLSQGKQRTKQGNYFVDEGRVVGREGYGIIYQMCDIPSLGMKHS